MKRLETKLQHYDWGDTDFLANLQGRPPSGRPEAELWAGAHESDPSDLEGGGSLLDAIAADPTGTLGLEVSSRYGRLPFLAKFLAAAKPLSLQAHPSPEQAMAGFEREQAGGPTPHSRERVYRDRSHKPELICPLTAFEAKCGFKTLDESRELFASLDTPLLAQLREILASSGPAEQVLGSALRVTLRLDSVPASELTSAVIGAAATAPRGSDWDRELDWVETIGQLHTGDPAVVASLLLNHVVMHPGQALYLGAGTLHSYLAGAGVEVMANSDNVVRAGLSSKHVDVAELLEIVDTEPRPAQVQTARGAVHEFDVPAPEFAVTRIEPAGGIALEVSGPEVLMVAEGPLEFVSAQSGTISADAGTAIWVPANESRYEADGAGTLFRVTIGG